MTAQQASAIIAFWRDAGPALWYAKDDAFDATIRERFEADHHAAARGEYAAWTADWQGSLALLLLLDQFPRNLFRGSAHAYATDPLARYLASHAVKQGHDQQCPEELRVFFYLPFEHSESIADQDRCIALCDALDHASGSDWAKWARLHRDIIARFGRFPHRNAAQGRMTTDEEQTYLDEGGFKG